MMNICIFDTDVRESLAGDREESVSDIDRGEIVERTRKLCCEDTGSATNFQNSWMFRQVCVPSREKLHPPVLANDTGGRNPWPGDRFCLEQNLCVAALAIQTSCRGKSLHIDSI